jgi:hypothetical protein
MTFACTWRDGWFPFRSAFLTACVYVTCSLPGCGSVDPGAHADQPSSGAGGDAAGGAGGDGMGDVGNVGGDAGSGGVAGNHLGGDGQGGSPDVMPAGSLLPWAVGNSWTYRVTKGAVVTQKTITIGDLEEVGGLGPNATQLANHVTTAKGAGANDHTESWQAPDEENSDRIVRYREQAFAATTGMLQLEEHWAPSKLHVDGSADRTVPGASWLEAYSETKLQVGLPPTNHDVSERWTVLSDDETLEVPAGTFEHAIHLRKVGDGSTKDYWYERGVGKLKETGAQTEELVDYVLEP